MYQTVDFLHLVPAILVEGPLVNAKHLEVKHLSYSFFGLGE
jgi:hypothetical protein